MSYGFKYIRCGIRIEWVILFWVVFLTTDHSFATSKNNIRIGVPMHFPSFSYQDDGNEEVRGYGVDVLNTLCVKLGREPHFLVGQDQDLLRALRDGDLDLVIGVVLGEYQSDDFNFLEIRIFMKQYSFVYHPQNAFNLLDKSKRASLVLVKGQPYIAPGLLNRKEHLIQARTVKEALFMVNSGLAREYIDYSNQLVTYLIGLNGLQNIRQAGVRMGQFPLTIITEKNNAVLNSGLNLALGSAIKSGELDRVREKWLGKSYSSYLLNRFGPFFFGTGIILAVLIMIVFLWFAALKRKIKKVTLKLQETEQRYRQLIESSPDMVFLINREGTIRLANRSACDRLIFDHEAFTMVNLKDLVADKNFDGFNTFLTDLFATQLASLEIELKDRNDNSINVEIVAAILHPGSEAEHLACCSARDITKRKLMEKELIKSERLATMGKMAAGVAHEVNNPIGIILSHTEDLLSGELSNEEMQESLDIIRRNALRAGNITDTLLNQASSALPCKEECDLAVLAIECLNFLKPRMKKIRVVNSLEPERFWVRCDESKMQQVLINLLLNAVESMNGQGVIRMWMEIHQKTNKTYNRLWIEDSGKGIPLENRPFIFDPFFTHGKTKGVGLGLFVAEKIITKYDGEIIIDDSPLGGAAMAIDLPRAGNE
ncbi:MAG: ATP-binding protein [Pseudomonadota bacterium]